MRITITIIGAALLLASAMLASEVVGQNSTFVASGRVESAGPLMSIGAAAGGVVSEVLVHEGSRVHPGELLVKLDCRPIEAEVRTREAHLAAARATYDRFRNGSRPDEIAVGDAVVGYSQARLDEAEKTLRRTELLQEGVTVTTARLLEVQRDARIAAAQLAEARARLALLRAGAREEDIRQAEALRDAAAADLETSRARLEQCSVRAPAGGIVLDVLANPGQFVSLAVPQPLLHLIPDGPLRVRAEVEVRDFTHVCLQQHATITSDAFAGTSLSAEVVTISPAVTARSLTAAAGAATAPANTPLKDVVPVVLRIDRATPDVPVGAPVTVRFDPCPSKS